MSRALVAALAVLALETSSCASPVTGVVDVILPDRPELSTYVDEKGGPGVLFVWGTGPVDLIAPFTANCPAHPVGVIGGHRHLGSAFGGHWPRAPSAGDTLTLELLPGPLTDSLGVTTGAAAVTFFTPDSALASAWAFVPQGPCGPDTIRSYVLLVRTP